MSGWLYRRAIFDKVCIVGRAYEIDFYLGMPIKLRPGACDALIVYLFVEPNAEVRLRFATPDAYAGPA